jgi:hypothetical protein
MIPFVISLSADAANDIDTAVNYYNNISSGLGFEFADTLDIFFGKISRMPYASAIRYDNVRVKPIDTFPFTIHFTINDPSSVIILRIFNTQQQPFW